MPDLPNQTARIAGRISHARRYLADLYEDAQAYAEANQGKPGVYTFPMRISDAIDALDDAYAAAPKDEPTDEVSPSSLETRPR